MRLLSHIYWGLTITDYRELYSVLEESDSYCQTQLCQLPVFWARRCLLRRSALLAYLPTCRLINFLYEYS